MNQLLKRCGIESLSDLNLESAGDDKIDLCA